MAENRIMPGLKAFHGLLLASAVALIGVAARADEKGDRISPPPGSALAAPSDALELDYEEAERAVRAGRARPLAEIVARVSPQLGGEIVGIELERSQGRFAYEFKVITPAGRLREVRVDALTGDILGSESD